MTTPKPAYEWFAADVTEHQMTVALDRDGYLHLKFRKPLTGMYWFDIIAWPGTLTIRGDMGTFVFARETDMLSFFRGQRVNPMYLSGRRIGGTDYIALTHADPDGSAGGDAQPAAYPPWPKELGERPAWLDHLSDEALRRQWEAIKDQRRKLQAALRDLDEQEEPLVAEHMSRRGMWRPRPAGNPDSTAGK